MRTLQFNLDTLTLNWLIVVACDAKKRDQNLPIQSAGCDPLPSIEHRSEFVTAEKK